MEHVEHGGTDAGRREEQSCAGSFEGSCEGALGRGAGSSGSARRRRRSGLVRIMRHAGELTGVCGAAWSLWTAGVGECLRGGGAACVGLPLLAQGGGQLT